MPLQRIDVVLGSELAFLSLERRVVGEVDPGMDANGPGLAVGRNFGHRRRGIGLELERPRQIVVLKR